tara:strand:- start:1822 stop:2820 length:999 start_codon:yes stop_codon:yes gene_type:complete
MSAKSTHLKLYDENEEHKFSVSCTNDSQKLEHATQVKFDSTLSLSHSDNGPTSNDFIDFVLKVRGEDATHQFSSNLLDGEITSTEGLIATEGINYLAHKASIESSLSTEEARSIASTNDLGSDINDAAIARINNAATLTSSKLNMISDRQTAITGYNTHVQDGVQEVQTQKTSGDAAVTQRIDTLMSIGEVDETKLMDVVTEYQAADTAQISLIAGIQSDFDALKIRIDDVLAQESGSSGSSAAADYYVKITGLWYGGYSSRVKIVLNLEDGTPFYENIQVGDVYEIQATGHTETVTVTSTDGYVAGVQFALNFDSALTNTYNTEYVTFVKQ